MRVIRGLHARLHAYKPPDRSQNRKTTFAKPKPQEAEDTCLRDLRYLQARALVLQPFLVRSPNFLLSLLLLLLLLLLLSLL